MNIRIDDRLKARGDSALEAVGFSPSRAARALWQFAADNISNPDAIREELERLEGNKPPRNPLLAAAEEGWNLVDNFYSAHAITPKATGEDMDFRQERDAILAERLTERGLR